MAYLLLSQELDPHPDDGPVVIGPCSVIDTHRYADQNTYIWVDGDIIAVFRPDSVAWELSLEKGHKSVRLFRGLFITDALTYTSDRDWME
jgi:hypothetical protein